MGGVSLSSLDDSSRTQRRALPNLSMAAAAPDARFCVGFSSASKQAREGGGLPGCSRGLRPSLPPDIIRLIDALVRRLEREDVLLALNGGVLGATLCEAAAAGGPRDVAFLLARGADVNFLRDHLTPLVLSARNGHLPVVRILLKSGGSEYISLWRALDASAQRGHAAVVAFLVDRGADMNHDTNPRTEHKHLPLLYAVKGRHLETARVMLDRGARVSVNRDEALKFAVHDGELEMTRLLLDRGANVGVLHWFDLRRVQRAGHLELATLLQARGVAPLNQDD